MSRAGILFVQRFGQSSVQADGKAQGWRAAAVDRRAGTTGNLRLNDQTAPLVQRTDAVGAVELVGGKAHGIHAVQPQIRLAHSLRCVNVQAAAGVRLDDLGNLLDGLHRAKLAVHGTDGNQNRIIAHQFPQLIQVYPAIAVDVEQVNFIPLLLQDRE